MKRVLYTSIFLAYSLFFGNIALGQTNDPLFVGGRYQSLPICENAPAASIDTLLAIIDSNTVDMETWSATAYPIHGILTAGYTAMATGDTLVPTGLTYMPGPGYSGIDSFRITISDGFNVDTTTVYITVIPTPSAGSISGMAGVCAGDSTLLTDVATGGIWSGDNSGVATVNAVTGSVTGISAGSAAIYYTVSNACGSVFASWTMTVDAVTPTAPSGIGGLHAVCVGASITLRDATTGGEWISGNPAVATVDPVSGQVTGVAAGVTAVSYAEVNFCASYYSVVPVSVDPFPSIINGPSQLCLGNNASLTDSVAGGAWSSNNTSIAVINTFTGIATGESLGTTTLTYTAGVAACTATLPITVNPTPSTFSITGGGSYCSGGAGISIGLGGSAAGISYRLYLDDTATSYVQMGAGAALDFGMQTAAGSYSIVGTDTTTGCDKNMTGTVNITINPLPNAYAVTGGGSYCAGGTGSHIYLDASQNGISYTIDTDGHPIGMAMAGTGAGLDFGLFNAAGAYTIIATNTTTGCTRTMTGSATITVNSNPVAFAVIGGGSYCTGGLGAHIGLDSSATGVNYQLYNGTAPYGGAAPGTGVPLDLGLVTTAGSYMVVATNATTTCTTDMTGSATIAVNPAPAAYPMTGGGNYCMGGAGRSVSLSNSDIGINYQLYLGMTAIGATMAGDGSSLNFGLQTVPGIYTVTATNTLTGCTSTMTGSSSISIDSLPATFNVTGGGGYCAGGLGVYVGLSGSDAGTAYQLYYDGASFGFSSVGSGGALDMGLETAAGNYTVVAANRATGCTDTMTGSATVTVNPMPAAITGGDTVYTADSIMLAETTPGGVWSVTDASLATVSAAGIVYGDSVGIDSVIYTLPTGCSAALQILILYAPQDTTLDTTGTLIKNVSSAGTITIFPNPATTSVNIKWDNQAIGKACMVITDIAGEEVYKKSLEINNPTGYTTITPNLADGMYLLTITSGNTNYTTKLVLRHE